MKVLYNSTCNLAQTLNIVGEKWTLLVLHSVMIGNNTYKEIQESLGKIPTNILSDRLKVLEKNGLITIELYNEHPPRYRYLMTPMGEEFSKVFHSMIIWSHKYLDDCKRTVYHESCNHPVELEYYCEHCKELTTDVVVKAGQD